jgi:hypothetical protein
MQTCIVHPSTKQDTSKLNHEMSKTLSKQRLCCIGTGKGKLYLNKFSLSIGDNQQASSIGNDIVYTFETHPSSKIHSKTFKPCQAVDPNLILSPQLN